jgi:hypothetical protein
MTEIKRCEQCQIEKAIECFYRRPQKNDPDKRIKICIDCYKANLAESKRQREEHQRQWREEQQLRAAKLEAERTARMREEEQRHQVRLHEFEVWYQQQPDRRCVDCKQVFPASAFGYTFFDEVDGVWLPQLHQRCKACHEAYRKRNKQVNPLCPTCNAPTRISDFLRTYQGYRLDKIKVCCKQCIPRFEALPESEQLTLLRRAMVKAYGETAVIYGLQYDDTFPCHHIGRTKHYARRMAEYKRNWYRDLQHHFVLQQLTFGPLSMEYESRWILHALKYQWPIDNFEVLKIGEDGLEGRHSQAKLIEAVQPIEPLIAPFKVVWPVIHEYFGNTRDAEVVNWYCLQHYRHAYPSGDEMRQRIELMERLHGLRC